MNVNCDCIKMRPTAKEFINALFELMAAQAHTTQSNRKAIMIIGSNARIQCAILSVYRNIISSVVLPNRIRRGSSIDWPTRWWSVRLCQPSVDSICTWMRQSRTRPSTIASFRRIFARVQHIIKVKMVFVVFIALKPPLTLLRVHKPFASTPRTNTII